MIKFNSKSNEYGWLSNMYQCPVIVPVLNEKGFRRDITFSCVEAAFQGYKVFSNLGKTNKHPEQEIREFESFATLDGFKARKKGSTVNIPNLKTWNAVRVPIMKHLVSLKYKNPEMKKRLLLTGKEELVEDSPWDTFWGTRDGTGENHLGKITMEVRSGLEKVRLQTPTIEKLENIGKSKKTTPTHCLDL